MCDARNDNITDLEIIKCPSWYMVIEFHHHIPWPVTNPDKYN
jgi:hypothetical protein